MAANSDFVYVAFADEDHSLLLHAGVVVSDGNSNLRPLSQFQTGETFDLDGMTARVVGRPVSATGHAS